MHVASVGSAFPRHRHSQEDVLASLRRAWASSPLARRADVIFANAGVEARHFTLPLSEYERPRSFGENNDAWIEAATELGEAAMRDALERAGIAPREVDAVVFTTVTGLATPSIDARLVHRLGLRPDVRRMPMFGLGCVAGAAGLARAADQVHGRRGAVAVLLSVELCSLTLQIQDVSMSNLIATGLFGDGATAVVIAGDGREPRSASQPSIVASRSVLYPSSERVMGWDVSEKGFQLVLSPEVPEVVRRHVRRDAEEFLAEQGLGLSDVSRFVLHPGGPKVLEAMQESLGITERETALTWRSLKQYGNLSSSSVLMVLKDTMEEAPPPPGSHGLVVAMGPGFCSEMVLLRWGAA